MNDDEAVTVDDVEKDGETEEVEVGDTETVDEDFIMAVECVE